MSRITPPRFLRRAGIETLLRNGSRPEFGALCAVLSYLGFLIFVFALPFGYSTAFLNVGLSLIGIGWVGRIISDRKAGRQRTPLDVPLALFFGMGVLASLLAPFPATSSFGYLWKHLRAVLLFYAVLHNGLGVRFRHIIIGFIIAAGFSATLGLWYYANDSRLGIDFMGRVGLQYRAELVEGRTAADLSAALRAELRTCNVPLSDTATFVPAREQGSWRIADPERERRYTIRADETHLRVYMIEQRLAGTFKMPNDLGAYLALTLPFVLGYFIASGRHLAGTWRGLRTDKRRHRILLGITAALGTVSVLMGTALALTLTRAAWVSVTCAALGIGSYVSVTTFLKGLRWKQGLLGLLLITVLLSTLFLNNGSRQAMLGALPAHITARFQTLVSHPAGFMSERPQWWGTSLDLIRAYPITGIGVGRFRDMYQRTGPAVQYYTPYHAHNIYLHIAVEQGLPSLLLFLWMGVVMWRAVLSLPKTGELWHTGGFLAGSGFLLSALVYGLADNIFHQRTVLLFWFSLGTIFYLHRFKDNIHEKTTDSD